MNLKTYTYTNQGGKENNEDFLDYYMDDSMGIFVLADGLGGHGNGETASQFIVRALLDDLKNAPEFEIDYMREAFQRGNQMLLKQQEKMCLPNMKTTAVVLMVRENKAIWGHLGDSRLYFYSDEALAEVTEDHSVTYKKYRSGEILYQDINTDDDRASLLGAFGNKEKFVPDFINKPKVIKKGDAFLLCSDGFWEYVYDEEMYIDFLKSGTSKQWAELMLLRLLKRAKPYHDNFSLITIFVE